MLNCFCKPRIALSIALLSIPVAAQVAHTGYYASNGASLIGRETMLPSAAFPSGFADPSDRYPLSALQGIYIGSNRPNGGVAVDLTNGDVWTTSVIGVFPVVGNGISVESNPNYRPAVTGAAPLTGIVPFGTPVQGLAIDSTGAAFGQKALFLVDQNATLHVLTATIPPAPIIPPVALAGLANQVPSGAGWDPTSGTLWVSTRQGRIIEYTPTGAMTGNARVVTGFTFPIVGCTVNTTTSTGFVAPPFCSTQNPGDFNVCVVDLTGAIIDSVTNRIIPGTMLPGETPFGLGSSPDPQVLEGSSPGGISMALSAPLVNTLTPAPTLDVSGLVAGQTGAIAFDLCPLPTPIQVGTDAFWLLPASPSYITAPFTATGATFSLSLAAITPAGHGTQFTAQAARLTPTLSLSDALVLTVGTP